MSRPIHPASIPLWFGAALCFLIGLLYTAVTARILINPAFHMVWQVVVIILYTLLSFVPFVLCVYPGIAPLRKSVDWIAAALELLVLGIFLWIFWCILQD